MQPTVLVTLTQRRLSGATGLRIAAVLFMTLLTIAAAQVSVQWPFTPVPFTFQPMVVLLAGAVLGSRLGFVSQALYLAAGLAGWPVFAASPLLPQGPARLIGPTAGYLLSYPIAAFVTGYLAERGFGRRYLLTVASLGAGLAVIFTCGVLWLELSLAPGSGARLGLYPFLPLDIAKLFLAAAIVPGIWRFIGRQA